MSTVLNLPYDILEHIFAELSAADVFHFIATSRRLYQLGIDDEYTWRRFCLPYGVQDASAFPGRSFRTIYTRLLHPYGPLLGLWASDYPFKGNIIQFRLLPDHWHRSGEPAICGDVWRFTMESANPRPHHPYYVEFVQIGFTPQSQATPETANEVCISWHLRSERDLDFPFILATNALGPGPPWVRPENADPDAPRPSLHTIAPTTATLELTNYFSRPLHTPEFPSATPPAPWYDTARGVPRLPGTRGTQEPPPPIAPPSQWPLPRTGNVRYVDGAAKPASIAFFPPERAGLGPASDADAAPDLHHPMHPLSGPYAAIRPRYYALREVCPAAVDPREEGWAAGTLEGLWLGDYGPHGTECLFVEHDTSNAELRAWKITGDPNVPRGVWSWCAYLEKAVPWADASGETLRAYEGHGRIALHGYMEPSLTPTVVIVYGADEIRVAFDGVLVARYIRYRTVRGRTGGD